MYCREKQIEKWYNERYQELEQICCSKDYDKAILVYNNKGLQSSVEVVLGLKPKVYRMKALHFLKQASEEVRDVLRSEFPNEIFGGV